MERFVHLCTVCQPFLEGILSALSASDASAFLSATGLRRITPSGTIKKYLDIRRDFPEHESWMKLLSSRGHAVILAGAGLRTLQNRINCPEEHPNRSEKIRLWILVVTAESYKRFSASQAPDGWASHHFVTNVDGQVQWGTPEELWTLPHIKPCGDLCQNYLPATGIILPSLGTWPKCGFSLGRGWHIDPLPNYNGIELVCYYDFVHDLENPEIKIPPFLFTRDPGSDTEEIIMPYLNLSAQVEGLACVLSQSEVRRGGMTSIDGLSLVFGCAENSGHAAERIIAFTGL
jgi:hypothetical protein